MRDIKAGVRNDADHVVDDLSARGRADAPLPLLGDVRVTLPAYEVRRARPPTRSAAHIDRVPRFDLDAVRHLPVRRRELDLLSHHMADATADLSAFPCQAHGPGQADAQGRRRGRHRTIEDAPRQHA